MLSSLLLGCLLLLVLMLFMRWFGTAAPGDILRTLKWSGLAVVVGLAVVLAASGRLGWALAALSALVPWITRALRLRALLKEMAAWTTFTATGAASSASSSSSSFSDSKGGMTRAEALRILGLDADATPEQIHEAYRRLMTRLHPDHGGSGYLAAQINHARDVLLGS